MYRASNNHVIASERVPAMFRPSNQAVLLPSQAANPCMSEPSSALPGMGVVVSGNGMEDAGLSSPAKMRRFKSALDTMRRSRQIQATGTPTANPVPITYTDFRSAAGSMPAAPGTSKEVTARIQRDADSAWEILRYRNANGAEVFQTELVKRGQTELQSPELSTETDARNFILSQQFARVNIKGLPRGTGFDRSLVAKTTGPLANAGSAAVQGSQVVPWVPSPAPQTPGVYQPSGNRSNLTRHEVRMLELDGMGALPLPTAGAIALDIVGIASLFVFFRR